MVSPLQCTNVNAPKREYTETILNKAPISSNGATCQKFKPEGQKPQHAFNLQIAYVWIDLDLKDIYTNSFVSLVLRRFLVGGWSPPDQRMSFASSFRPTMP